MKVKVCSACGVSKPHSEFRIGGFGPLRTCKTCQRKMGYGGRFIAPKPQPMRGRPDQQITGPALEPLKHQLQEIVR